MQENNVGAFAESGIEQLRPIAFNVQAFHLAVSSNINGERDDSELSSAHTQQQLQARGCVFNAAAEFHTVEE